MSSFPSLTFNGPMIHPVLGMDVSEMLQRSFDLLLESEFCGIDPGSYYSPNLRRFHSNGKSIMSRAWNKGFHTFVALGGGYTPKIFSLPEVTSTKAAALTLSGLASLRGKPEVCDPEELETTANALIDWIVDRRNDDIGAWTPDFQYEIRGAAIPANVLGTINTVFCCEALWQWRDAYQGAEQLIISAAEVCLSQLPRYETETEFCFSYNPSARYFVHNANLFVALLLARASYLSLGQIFDDNIVERCVRYTLNDFDRAGRFRYAGPPTINNTVDNYHTGFVIRALADLLQYISDDDLKFRISSNVDKGLKTYSSMFAKPHGIPKFHKSSNHIQAHSVAEALLISAKFSSLLNNSERDRLQRSARKSVTALWNCDSKSFDSEVRVIGDFCFWRNQSPMPRWAWAWMFSALTQIDFIN